MMPYRRFFFFQAEDGIRYLVRSRGLGDVYKRQARRCDAVFDFNRRAGAAFRLPRVFDLGLDRRIISCLLYTSDAADERSSVDLGGRSIIKKKNNRDERYMDVTIPTPT